MSVQSLRFMGRTKTGSVSHLFTFRQVLIYQQDPDVNEVRALCGAVIDETRMVSNRKTGIPIAYTDHWDSSNLCQHCKAKNNAIAAESQRYHSIQVSALNEYKLKVKNHLESGV